MSASNSDVILTPLPDGHWQVHRYGRRMLIGSAATVARYFDTKVHPAASVEVRLPHEIQIATR